MSHNPRNRQDGVMGLFIGVSRSGKSTPIKVMIKKAKRLLIWDAKAEYTGNGIQKVRSLPELLKLLQQTKNTGKFAFIPTNFSKKEFDAFCRLAHIWNKQKESVIVIEELAAVTNSGKAFGYWGVLINQSLGLGATLLATVQRGQEVDKSIMNNATYLHICQHNTESDAQYMAKKIGVNIETIPRVPLVFIIWSPSRELVIKGSVQFKNKLPVFVPSEGMKPKLTISTRVGLFNNLTYT